MADQPVLSPQIQSQLETLLGLSTQRIASQQPIHQAAMAMAQHLAPGYAQAAMSGGAGGGSSSGLGLGAPSSGASGPGLGTMTAAAFAEALLKNGGNNPLMQALKALAGGGSDPTFGGLIQGNKPPVGGTGFPSVPTGGSGGSGDPTQPGGAQGQGFGIGLPFWSAYGGSGSAPTGANGQQPSFGGGVGGEGDDPTRTAR